MEFDIIVPVGPGQIPVVHKTIESLLKYLNPSQIYIVSSKDTFDKINTSKLNNLHFLNEDKIVDGLSLSEFKKYFVSRISSDKRAGWYFQQFIKMGVAYLEIISDSYLIWDADCVLLNKLSFFENGKTIVTKTHENHLPYFNTILKLLKIEKQVDFSFISEHFLFNKTMMKELIYEISNVNDNGWYWKILDAIDSENLEKSGFSEYETYGNYMVKKYPDIFRYRELPVFRYGSMYCGMRPTKFDLWILSLAYTYVSFETWTKKVYSTRKLVSLVYKQVRKNR